MINLHGEIEQAKTVDDLKPLLRQLIQHINALDSTKGMMAGDVVFKQDKGVVMLSPAGRYYRLILTDLSPVTTGLEEIGKVI